MRIHRAEDGIRHASLSTISDILVGRPHDCFWHEADIDFGTEDVCSGR
jgi:hypothetical protein